MENQTLEIQVKELTAKDEWEKIIDLLDAKEAVPEGLSTKLLVNLGFAYSMYSKKIEAPTRKELCEKKASILALSEQANILALRRDDLNETLYSMAIKNLAYTFYDTFANDNIDWCAASLGSRQQKVLVNKTRYKNMAAFLYEQITRQYPNDIKSRYRYGKLLFEANNIYRFETQYINDGKRTLRDSYSKYLKESYLTDFYSEAEIDDYIKSLPTKTAIFSYYGTEQFLKAAELYESCTDEKIKQQKKYYIRAMYNYCKTYLHEQERSRNLYKKLDPKLVRNFLAKIMLTEGIRDSFDVDGEEIKKYALGDHIGEDAKFIYKMKGDCIVFLDGEEMFYEKTDEQKQRNLKALKQAIFYAAQACQTEILQRKDRSRGYSLTRYPFDDFNIRYGTYLREYMHLDENAANMIDFFRQRVGEITAYYNRYYKNKPVKYNDRKKAKLIRALEEIELYCGRYA